jgi:hypothetical protein
MMDYTIDQGVNGSYQDDSYYPVNNLLVENYDPMLGGRRFEIPPWTPNCPFLNAVKETPESNSS